MKKFSFLFCLLLSVPFATFAQDDYDSKVNLGVGIGLDYGGIGFRLTGHPNRTIGIFGGVGYAFAGVGFNGGINANFKPKGRATGYFTGMYGYNGALLVMDDGEDFKKFYYGPSFGLGLKLASRRNDQNFWNFELLLPIRDPDFQKDLDNFEDNGIEMSPVLPIAWSIGYHFRF